MILSILVVVLIGLIAFFHFTQGLLASTISAFCAAVAALVAFSYYQTLVAAFTGGALAAWAEGAALAGLFAILYLLLRSLIDGFVPGNIRLPVPVDKAGGAVMGVVAGFFATAVLTLTAQILPFGPTVAGYAPYPLADAPIAVDRFNSRRFGIEAGEDAVNFTEVQIPDFNDAAARAENYQAMWLPVDDWFLGLVSHVSGNGSLAGPRPLEALFPHFKDAAFAQRLGLQRAANQAAVNTNARSQMTVHGVYALPVGDAALPQVEGEVPFQPGGNFRRNTPSRLDSSGDSRLIVVRMLLDSSAADRNQYVRFSPGMARLVAGGRQFFPVATVESGAVAVAHRVDAFLIAARGVDFVYELPAGVFVEGEVDTLAPGTFVEFKRFARVDLSGNPVGTRFDPDPRTHVERNDILQGYIGAVLRGTRVTSFADLEGDGFRQLRQGVVDESAPPTGEPQTDARPTIEDRSARPMQTIRGARDEQERALQDE